MKPFLKALAAFLLLCASPSVFGQDLDHKARDFLGSLSEEMREQTLFPLADPSRGSFHYVPMQRLGPNLHDFNPAQKAAALALLQASLSAEGYRKSREIMALEEVLIALGNQYTFADGTLVRDPLKYHFTLFGDPEAGPWGWRFEGHHLSLNFTANGGVIVASTPSFMGSNPAVVPSGPEQGKQVLKAETTLALALLHSFSPAQLQAARFSESAPREILTGNQREATVLEPLGLSYSAMDAAQQAALRELLEVYIGNYIFEFSETFRQKIVSAGLEKLHFAWAGGTQRGTPHYYRIQGPMLLIEYDNTQNNANHVHTVVRDLTNDFAEDFLREHYQKDH
ncbi:DUF3500 domain-containing protein [Robiginitalea sp. M366]|uniref:DUF3500 domain-containing protein n=1 Tax=Robiginitalea aestuariiviva TaxID=3036903 RepID=UPI00240CFCC9|nr:DUF3500 domain-containing protein [Robiginitalea aestuariiviva]MDG1572153.1 DUF3500 domain-containing protein [Robiginitalea aestuariiviva]